MNRIQQRLKADKKILSIYFTAGFPELNDTVSILKNLETAGVDIIEIGLPFSDPLADGPTIQQSSTAALKNGMSTQLLFDQLEGIRDQVSIPLIAMGYFNPMLQYGMEAFCKRCQEVGIDGLIIPDLPLREYQLEYQELFQKYELDMVFLITPQTSAERIRQIDAASNSFIYMVSTASTTGAQSGFNEQTASYFKRIADMNLTSPQIVGFGISNEATFNAATAHSKGAIIGSAFIKMLRQNGIAGIADFIRGIRPE